MLQLALWHEVYLLDVPALQQELTEDDWKHLVFGLFNNDTILKLGGYFSVQQLLKIAMNCDVHCWKQMSLL